MISQTLCLRYFGTITDGPNKGRVLNGEIMESLCIGKVGLNVQGGLTLEQEDEINSKVENWLERAAQDKEKIDGRVEVCTRQYVKKSRQKGRVEYTIIQTF